MQKVSVTIHNRAGIHCRPSSVILNAIQAEFPEEKFTLTSDASGESCELNSIMALLAMGLAKNDKATLTAEGPKETQAIQKIAELLEKEYDFPPKQ